MTALFIKRDSERRQGARNAVPHILSAANMAYARVDRHQVIQQADGDVAGILGLGRNAELEGLSLDDVLHGFKIEDPGTRQPLSPKVVSEMIAASLQSLEPHRKTVILTTLDGRRVRANSWYDGQGESTFVLRDISVDSQYRDLFEIAMGAANAGFWSMDFKTGQFTYSASVMSRLTDREQALLQKNGLFAIIHPQDLQHITSEWAEIAQQKTGFDFKYRVRTEENPCMWQRSIGQITCAPDGTALGATAFVMDITEDVDKTQALQQERSASKAKSEFLARMSHEIRTPLNAIIGMSDSLRDEPLSDDVREVVTDIEQAAEGLHHLLSRTLDHAKLMSNSVEIIRDSTDIRELLETVSRLWKPQISVKGLSFRMIVDPNLPEILELDGFRLQQCLNNFLSNATKFTKTGTISLIAKQANLKGVPQLVLAVQDTGIGMTPEEAKRIFEPFAQADGTIQREYGGTGLGMTISHDLCELMGGQIKVKSALEAGSTFAMILPIDPADAKDVTAPETAPVLEDPPLQTKPKVAEFDALIVPEPIKVASVSKHDEIRPFEGLNVLCVEDNPINQKVVKRLIGKRVSELYFAENGREALNVLNTVSVDVVLMDIHMPVMDGIEATLEIRKSDAAYANVIIIALTADPDYQQRRICRNIGMDDTIAKPVRREDILDAFDRTLGKLSTQYGSNVAIRA